MAMITEPKHRMVMTARNTKYALKMIVTMNAGRSMSQNFMLP